MTQIEMATAIEDVIVKTERLKAVATSISNDYFSQREPDPIWLGMANEHYSLLMDVVIDYAYTIKCKLEVIVDSDCTEEAEQCATTAETGKEGGPHVNQNSR